jgi:hypothetical protein
MRKRKAVCLCPVLLVAACGPAVRSAPFKTVPPRPTDHQIVLFSTKLPTCPYEEIGLITAQRRHGFNSYESVLEAMKSRAREMGGDAVVALDQQQTVNGGTVIGKTVNINTGEALTGTVIRFTDSGCTR